MFSVQVSFQRRVFWEYLFRCELVINLANNLFLPRVNTYSFFTVSIYLVNRLLGTLDKGRGPPWELTVFNLPLVEVSV